MAPFPNLFSIRLKNHYDDFMSDENQTPGMFLRFFTGFLIISGLLYPVVLYHVNLIVLELSLMSTAGGLLIYSTIIIFNWFFTDDQDDDLF